jgi:hypothetical protein
MLLFCNKKSIPAVPAYVPERVGADRFSTGVNRSGHYSFRICFLPQTPATDLHEIVLKCSKEHYLSGIFRIPYRSGKRLEGAKKNLSPVKRRGRLLE